ncbi:alpha/beta hydrolase family protein [Entomomonas asaccharolytica]|uniref:Uncharacterized protein n=1 Tax=Entomomonas asaccharolytica TaxID=2785331 RepID=A0A974RW42_9GAMM|nr:hypothetical protein [Entomomonas asaccharolytica]QQP84800.1 hypothetical protein JHT90_10350 [Entomomonas asaccharolytica]
MSLKDQFKDELTSSFTSPEGTITTQKLGKNRPTTDVLILYIGGAGDKESYFFAGPYYNVIGVKRYIEQRIILKETTIDNSRYYCAYLGYNEVFRQKHMDTIIQDYICHKKNYEQSGIPPAPVANSELNARTEDEIKNLKIVIIGHSLGGWNGAHLASYLVKNDYPVHYLITIDPVGLGAIVRLISRVITDDPPSPKTENAWINIKLIGKGFDNFIAKMGERWIPGFRKPFLGSYQPTTALLPTHSYISKVSHAYAEDAVQWRAGLIKVSPSQEPRDRDEEEKLSVISKDEQTPIEILKQSLLQWLNK